MQVMYINNQGAGFADHIEIEAGITVSQFFEHKMPGHRPADFLIRVNRQPVTADTQLQEGDRISITPVKIDGARQ